MYVLLSQIDLTSIALVLGQQTGDALAELRQELTELGLPVHGPLRCRRSAVRYVFAMRLPG